jgi:hypothetical protein
MFEATSANSAPARASRDSSFETTSTTPASLPGAHPSQNAAPLMLLMKTGIATVRACPPVSV